MDTVTHIIYTVAGNVPDGYNLLTWKYNGKKSLHI